MAAATECPGWDVSEMVGHLTLTGPGGCRYTAGSGGETVELEVAEFCRVISGRASGTGLLAARALF